jgi:DNA-binding SARP family transcriptional activator
VLSQRLAVLGWSDLRFTDDEARRLARAYAPRLARRRDGVLAQLCHLADGWAAGLVLVLEHAGRTQAAPQVAASDENQAVFDYLSTEVLAELAPEAQEVLLATALLPSMTGEMARAVSGVAGAGAVLADFHRRGLLIERLASAATAYRYHPLFRAFLLARARPSRDTLERAAAVCAEGGLLDEAVALHAQAGASERTAAMVLEHAMRLMTEGRHRTLAAWIAQIGEGAVSANPWLRFWRATANMPVDPSGSRMEFDQAFAGFEAGQDAAGLYLSVAGAVQVLFIEADDFRRLDPWFDRLTRLTTQGPAAPSADLEALALTSALMAAAYARPTLPEAHGWAERALSLQPADAGTRARLAASLVMFFSIANRSAIDNHLIEQLRPELVAGLDPLTRIMVDEAHYHLSLMGSWREALKGFQRSLAIARAEGLESFVASSLAAMAQSFAVGGDEEAATKHLEEARAVAASVPSSHLIRSGLLEVTAGLCALCAGRFEQAADWLAQALERTQRAGMRWGEMCCGTHRALALFACGRRDEALRQAALMTGDVAPLGVDRCATELLAAEVALGESDLASARSMLSRALDYVRLYPSYGMLNARALPNVLAHALRDPVHGKWVGDQIVSDRIWPWPEHLEIASWPWALRLRSLGGFGIRGHLAGRSRKVQKAPLRLLKCVVAHGVEPLPVTAACDALWDGASPRAARRAFDLTLHRLRKLLGQDVVQLREGALTIDRTRCFVDAWAFASLGERAERRLRQSPNEARDGLARVLFDDALALYRGPLLPGEDDVTVVVGARDRLRRRFVRLVLAFASALEGSATEQAVAVYENALEIDELPEPLWHGLVSAYLALGRPGDAVKAYQRCQLALRAGGAAPSGELRALHDEARALTRPGAKAESRPAIPANPKGM